MNVTIVIPTYNEAENLPSLVEKILSLPNSNINLLVVDDNSPDGTGRVAEDLAEQHPGRMEVLHREGKMGLGSAYILGFRTALDGGAEAIGQMDADFSHDPEKLPQMIAMLENADLVLGSRYVEGGAVDEGWPFWRKGLSAWGNFYARTILGLTTRDVTTGYRLWRREALLGMPLEQILSSGYIFLVEMAFLAHKLGYRIGEVPIYFADRKWGKSKMNFRIQVEAALRVWQVRFAYRDLERKN
jgi:dolichol-phosphate mannosyltransferase